MADGRRTKLLIKHLPSRLSISDKTDLLKHFGAKEVVCMERRGKMRDAAFAEFSTQAEAARALSQLHQSDVLGSRLTVEYAKPFHEHLAAQQCSRDHLQYSM
ncbi:RNA-binding region-containing protein 3-like [Oculina patagonica]